MAAEVKITADIEGLKAQISQAVRLMEGMATKAKAAGAKTQNALNSKTAIKGVKDVFDPFSSNALVRVGAAVVAIYGVVKAVQLLDRTVHTLAKAEYLTPAQRGEMAFIAEYMDNIKEAAGSFTASALTAVGDMLTGGAVTDGGKDKAKEIAQVKTAELGKERTAAVEELRRAKMTDEELLADMVEKRAKLEQRIAKQTGDEKIKTSTELARISKSIIDQEKRVAEDNKRASADAVKQQEDTKNKGQFIGDLNQDIAIAKAKASGKTKLADKLTREKMISADARRIEEQGGLDPEAARAAAEALNLEAKGGSIKGYSGKQRAKNKFLDHRSFNQFFHPDSFFDKKDLTPRASDDFNSFFHPKDPQGKAAAARAGANTNKTKDPMEILKAQLAALEKITSF